jgi:hypothetical protein
VGLLALAFVACGGGGSSGGGSSSEDPQKVLDETFSPDRQIESADIDATLDVSIEGPGQSGNFTADLSGPIDGQGDGFPKFDLTAKLSGDGGGQKIDFEGGATSTGDAGFVSYKGTDYEVPASIFSYITTAYQAGQQQQNQQSQKKTLPQLKQSLTNVSNEGTEDVDGTETVHITGDIDVNKLVDVVGKFAKQAQGLGQLGATSQLPSPQELEQLKQLVTGASFDVFSGVDDHVLRRLDFNLNLQEPGGNGKATFGLSITLGSVNEPQTIEAPSDTKPLQDLLDQLGVGDLGSLGLGSLGGASGGGGAPSSADQIQCLQQAQTQQELQACVQ